MNSGEKANEAKVTELPVDEPLDLTVGLSAQSFRDPEQTAYREPTVTEADALDTPSELGSGDKQKSGCGRCTKKKPTRSDLAFGVFVRRLTQDLLDHRLPITQQSHPKLLRIESACKREFPQFDARQIRLKIRAQLKLYRRNLKKVNEKAVKAACEMKFGLERNRPILPWLPNESTRLPQTSRAAQNSGTSHSILPSPFGLPDPPFVPPLCAERGPDNILLLNSSGQSGIQENAPTAACTNLFPAVQWSYPFESDTSKPTVGNLAQNCRVPLLLTNSASENPGGTPIPMRAEESLGPLQAGLHSVRPWLSDCKPVSTGSSGTAYSKESEVSSSQPEEQSNGPLNPPSLMAASLRVSAGLLLQSAQLFEMAAASSSTSLVPTSPGLCLNSNTRIKPATSNLSVSKDSV
ncbi:unnamed protein product [Calicophoron daubneyi]|uniref:Nucleolar protein 4 helical domain-containing protein n=1 Tax=Calicophoron daubneyi TaxID=300641 RepID=A0AAV2T7L2_CALDB